MWNTAVSFSRFVASSYAYREIRRNEILELLLLTPELIAMTILLLLLQT